MTAKRIDMSKLLILQNALAAIREDVTPQAISGYLNYKIAADIIGDVIDDLRIWRNNDATVEELNCSCSALRRARELMAGDDDTIARDILAVYEGLADILNEVDSQ